ncbi:MAG: MFS transporter [Actinomycetota bacterium]|nr:MFS transporter [Actinomycetota bacterium]
MLLSADREASSKKDFMTSASKNSAQRDADHQHDNRWTILVIVATAQLMVVLDSTIVNIALPSAQKDLGFASSDRQWIVTAYALAFGSLLLLGGRISDIFGRKWTFVGGLIGFALASAVGGAADSFAVLVSSRALQGVFGAILAPAALSTLTNAFQNPAERGKAFGVFGAVAGGGGAVGLLLGGFLTEHLSWRWCFYVNLLFAAVAVTGALLRIRNEVPEHRPKIDVMGSATGALALFLIVFGFSHADTDGWTNTITLASLIIGALLLVAFVLIEQRVAHPLLPLHVVLDRTRGGAYLAIGMSAIAIFAVFLFLTYYLQLTRGFSPVQTGLAFLPMVVFILLGSTLSNIKLLPLVGARALITTGMALGAVGMFYLSRIGPSSGYAVHILPALPVMGLGFGLIFAPSINTATVGVARSEAGIASAMVNTMQQVGGSIGTALLSTIAANATTSYLGSRTGSSAESSAVVHGYSVAFMVSASIFVAGAIVVFALMRPFVRPAKHRAVEDAPARTTPSRSRLHTISG